MLLDVFKLSKFSPLDTLGFDRAPQDYIRLAEPRVSQIFYQHDTNLCIFCCDLPTFLFDVFSSKNLLYSRRYLRETYLPIWTFSPFSRASLKKRNGARSISLTTKSCWEPSRWEIGWRRCILVWGIRLIHQKVRSDYWAHHMFL